jgi:hypothetical protein
MNLPDGLSQLDIRRLLVAFKVYKNSDDSVSLFDGEVGPSPKFLRRMNQYGYVRIWKNAQGNEYAFLTDKGQELLDFYITYALL